jgi:hypothetical protein
LRARVGQSAEKRGKRECANNCCPARWRKDPSICSDAEEDACDENEREHEYTVTLASCHETDASDNGQLKQWRKATHNEQSDTRESEPLKALNRERLHSRNSPIPGSMMYDNN